MRKYQKLDRFSRCPILSLHSRLSTNPSSHSNPSSYHLPSPVKNPHSVLLMILCMWYLCLQNACSAVQGFCEICHSSLGGVVIEIPANFAGYPILCLQWRWIPAEPTVLNIPFGILWLYKLGLGQNYSNILYYYIITSLLIRRQLLAKCDNISRSSDGRFSRWRNKLDAKLPKPFFLFLN